MSKQNNPVWRFFASVKLALTVLILLAVTSIIGTLIKQGQPPSYYVQEFGPELARVLDALDIPSMYSSWWYVALLGLFAVNLVICTLERLPGAWRMAFQNNPANSPRQLEKLGCSYCRETGVGSLASSEYVKQAFIKSGWRRLQQTTKADSIEIYVQKGAWSRLGVYVVHLSILIVLTGAVIGNIFGMQAYVFVPEEKSVDTIFIRYSNQAVPLGFELRCESFEKSFYANGMIKQYRAELAVSDQERNTQFQKSVIVNDPLSYRGLNFYIGDSFPTKEYFINIRNQTSGMEQAFRVPPKKRVFWPEADAYFQIEDLNLDQDGRATGAKISFVVGQNSEPSIFWISENGSTDVQQSGTDFTLFFRQYHEALLLVTKDPGVWTVYIGSALMVLGLLICFFMSHRRIWVQIVAKSKKGARIHIGGMTNKNKIGFEQQFQKLTRQVDKALEDANGKAGL